MLLGLLSDQITDQIHELIVEDRRISAKSIAEQLDISGVRVGSIIHEDLDMRKLSAKWVLKCLNADQKLQRCQSSEQLLEFFQHDPNYFLSRLVTMDETWLHHYDSEAKQQSMEWRHSVSPRPKKFWVQKSAGKLLAWIFLGSRRYPPHWLSSKGPNSQRRVLLISACVIEGNFEGKTPRKCHQGGLVFCTTMPQAHRSLATHKQMAYLGFQCLDHPTYSPDLAPSDYHLFPRLKNHWKVALFRPTRRSLLPRRPDWMDKLLNFFLSDLRKLELRVKKCIEASWGVCWINPEFVPCSLFPSRSGQGIISTLSYLISSRTGLLDLIS